MSETPLPLGLIDTEREWMDNAYCRINKIPMENFFPERGASQGAGSTKETACKRCSVIDECLNYALNNHISIGIFGGKSGRERRELQRKRREQSARQRYQR